MERGGREEAKMGGKVRQGGREGGGGWKRLNHKYRNQHLHYL